MKFRCLILRTSVHYNVTFEYKFTYFSEHVKRGVTPSPLKYAKGHRSDLLVEKLIVRVNLSFVVAAT